MASYYYLVSTLPTLRYDEDIPFSLKEFMEMCHRNMSSRDYRILEEALQAKDSRNSVVSSWNRYYENVNRELVEQRAKKLSLDNEEYRNSGEKEQKIADAVRSAVNAKNVLEGEMILFGLYSEYLDELASQHYFDMTAIVCYALKLKLLERKRRFTTEGGNAEFRKLFCSLQSSINSI